MLFNSNTLNVIPLLTFLIALNHCCVLIWFSISTDAVLFGILSYCPSLHTSFNYGLCSFDLFYLISRIFFCLACYCSVSVFSISAAPFFFLFRLRAWIILRIKSYIWCEVVTIWFSLSFLATWLNHSLFMYLFISLLSL